MAGRRVVLDGWGRGGAGWGGLEHRLRAREVTAPPMWVNGDECEKGSCLDGCRAIQVCLYAFCGACVTECCGSPQGPIAQWQSSVLLSRGFWVRVPVGLLHAQGSNLGHSNE